MGRNLKILITLFSMTALYGGYYWGIPAFVNLPAKVNFIEQTVLEQSGYKITLENPTLKMGIIPAIQIKADNFAILNDDNSKALDVKNPYINIRLLPLIFKEIDIHNFSAKNIETNLIFDTDSKLKLGQYIIDFRQDKMPLKLTHAKIHLDSYSINLYDKIQSKKITMDGKYLTINNFENNKHFDFSTIAEIQTGKKKSFIKSDIDLKLPLNKIDDNQCDISGHIVNLDLSDFSIYAKSLSKDKIKALSGIINLTAQTTELPSGHKSIKTNLYLDNLGIFQDIEAKSIHHNGRLSLKSNVSTIKNGLQINDAQVTGKGISAFSSGKITKLKSKMPSLDIKVTINKSKAEEIIPLLPGEADLCPDIDLFLLKQTVFKGDIIGNLDIKGKADMPDVKGNILVSNAFMVRPIPNSDKATIKITFLGDKLNLDVRVPTGPTQTVWVKGPIHLYTKYTDIMITSTDSVDLKTAQIVLNPLHDILHFELGPVPIMDIKGKGGIDLHIIGTKENPHGWGQFYFRDGVVSFLDIHNMVIKNASGTLDFDNQNTFFQSKTANLNGKPISVKGTCSLLGILNFNIETKGQNIEKLLHTIKTSPMLADIQKLTEPIENAQGLVNASINLTGKVKNPKDIAFNKNLFAKGTIELLSNSIKLKGAPVAISKTSGSLKFNNMDTDFNLQSNLNNSIIKINGKIKDNICNAEVISHKFNLGDAIKTLPSAVKLPYKHDLATINTSFIGKYNGNIQNIDYNNVYLKGNIYSNRGAKSAIIVDNSNFELKNSTFKLPKLQGTFKKSPYFISLNVAKMFDKNRVVNGSCKIKSLDMNLINDNAVQYILPPKTAKALNDIEFLNGNIDISAKIRNNNLNAYSVLDDVSLLYKPKQTKLTINSGNVLLKNDLLYLNKINSKLGQMPLFLDGKIANVQQNPNLNLYINAKPTQEFFDQFFNKNALYPIKLKGDAILTARVNGDLNNLNTRSTLDILENSSLYYMGASIGDIENPVKLTINNTYSPNKIRVNKFQYDKIISSQNNKPFVNTQLNANGTINLLKNNVVRFNNFKVVTQNPTDAKIFNIIFRKPFMKQGVFTSDLILNGTSLSPKIKGELDVTSIDIPFLDSTIRDINLNFKNDKIHIKSKGTVLTNDINLNAVMKNRLTPPYIIENAKLKLPDFNVNQITDTLRDLEAEATKNNLHTTISATQNFDISQIIIQKAEIEADKIKIRNINADNFIAQLELRPSGLLDVNNFKFEIAQGSVFGQFKHNLNSHNTNLNITLNQANASIMSEALFDLKGQVYGNVNGQFVLSCNGDSQDNCFKTLNGNGSFKIADGRMPKLGSLEYLLKAGNLLKGGFTGLSINSLIDLVTPLKTGNFESISGDIHIANGIADKINILSNGNDLNMYMTGSYNIITSVADMNIYGSLTKNITTVFGKIKNASLNTLFNTIPGINDSTEKLLLQEDIAKIPNIKNATDIYRIFFVDINGDINGENYVRSFKWVK